MGRVFLLMLIVAAVLAVLATLRQPRAHSPARYQEADVPKTVQTISYVLLIVLMFGVVTGWLGGL